MEKVFCVIEDQMIGVVTGVNKDRSVKVMLLNKLSVGDKILIKKDNKDVMQVVESMRLAGIEVKRGFVGNSVEVKMEGAAEVSLQNILYKI